MRFDKGLALEATAVESFLHLFYNPVGKTKLLHKENYPVWILWKVEPPNAKMPFRVWRLFEKTQEAFWRPQRQVRVTSYISVLIKHTVLKHLSPKTPSLPNFPFVLSPSARKLNQKDVRFPASSHFRFSCKLNQHVKMPLYGSLNGNFSNICAFSSAALILYVSCIGSWQF